jgi:NAD(P)-dependent dehydrogenase (short-subunit alcohol dehydrogenase family)
MSLQLKNFLVIVTGGTGGLGMTVVSEYSRQGATVVTNYRDPAKMRALEKKVGSSDQLIGIQADLTSEKMVQSFFKEYKRKFKRLDVLVHTLGGFWMGGEIAETSLEKWTQLQNLNLTSTFLCTREAFRMMKSQCSGKIFTVSAQAADTLPGKMGAYAVSKAGVMALTRIIATEGKSYNIQANCLLPSIIDTAENRKAMPDADFTRWVTPKEIAQLLIQLSKPETNAMSQSVLRVYGKV